MKLAQQRIEALSSKSHHCIEALTARLGVAISRSRSRDDEEVHFLYTGQPPAEIPRDVTHVRVDPAVGAVGERAFYDCECLEEVELYQGLLEIRDRAFRNCRSLRYVTVPSTVRAIDDAAFQGCTSLVEVRLCEGL